MKKRFLICIAALLVAVMFAVLLAACGDGEQNNDNETAQNNGNGTTTAPGSDFAADITAWDVGVSVDSGQTLGAEIDRQRLLEILRSATSWVVEATIEYSHSDTEQNYHAYSAVKYIRDGDDYVQIRDDKDHVVEYDETGSEDFVSDWSGYSVELYNFGTEIVLSKEITQNAVRSRVNGTLVNQEFIKQLKNHFLDIHSQHQTYAFMQPKYHINLVNLLILSRKEKIKK